MLVNGLWTKEWQPVQDKDKDGRFIRQISRFRNWISADGQAGPTGRSIRKRVPRSLRFPLTVAWGQ